MKLKWGDFLVFIVIASAIAGMLLLSAPKSKDTELTALIIQDGEVLYEIDLSGVDGQKEYLLDGGDVIIEAEAGRIRFVESDCPNQICVHTGWISRANQIAACIPNRILIKIVGGYNEVDVVVQ
jgi:hypothetical protein